MKWNVGASSGLMRVLWGIKWNEGARGGIMLVMWGMTGHWVDWVHVSWLCYRLPREQALQVVKTLLRVVLNSLAVVLMQSVELVNSLLLV